jgi:hypothetical protein
MRDKLALPLGVALALTLWALMAAVAETLFRAITGR